MDVFKFDLLNTNLFSYDWGRGGATRRGEEEGAQQGGEKGGSWGQCRRRGKLTLPCLIFE